MEIDLGEIGGLSRCWEKTCYREEAEPPVHYNHPAHMVSIKDHPIVLSVFLKLSLLVETDLGSFCELHEY